MGFSESCYDGWLDRHFGESGIKLTVIELGCGWGDDTSFLLTTGHGIVACDYSPEALAKVRERYPEAQTRLFDFRGRFPFQDGEADVIIASLCLHFYARDDLQGILREIRRVLRADGRFLCRLNSDRDRARNVPGEVMLEPGLYMTGEGTKRFYTKSMIRDSFKDWNIISVNEYETEKFAKRKALFEIVMTPRAEERR